MASTSTSDDTSPPKSIGRDDNVATATTTAGGATNEASSESSSDGVLRGVLCCGMPSSTWSFLPSIFVTVAFILSVCAHAVCDFTERTVTLELNGTMNSGAVITAQNQTFLSFSRGVGFWSYEGVGDYQGICLQYPDNFDRDSAWKAGQAFGVMSSVIGGLTMIALWFASCVPFSETAFRMCGAILIFVTLFEGLTFLLLDSSQLCKDFVLIDGMNPFSVECTMARGMRLGISAVVFWFISSVGCCSFSPPEVPPDRPARRQKTTVEEITHPDGTSETKTTTEFVDLEDI
uniref:Uncharacterized protein n=1 Tax=Leptocylindrus danicus TaxID=163516 RepID=A0A7S2K978_9STRA|mmetsp:Transcript_20034/g.29853  ORF Transcript_20034/g.29853 Transcript_20034/m.29853 type:complete len:290 (+) Transcript_20034:172-1041(+)